MKRILDPQFRYTPSYATDIRATFKRARQEQSETFDCRRCGAQCDSTVSDACQVCGRVNESLQ